MLENRLRLLSCTFVLSLASTASGIEYELKDQNVLELKMYRLQSTISVEDGRVLIGEAFQVDVRVDNLGHGNYLYNPFFNSLLPPSAALAIFDAQGKYVGDLLHDTGGSNRRPSPPDWIRLPHKSYVGFKLESEAGLVPGTEFGRGSRRLPPGKYYLQMVYHSRLATRPPFRTFGTEELWREDLNRWRTTYTERDVMRSNVLEIQLVKSADGVRSVGEPGGPGGRS